ncbi:TetR/AcrR family transcriptional regulator [Urechidicola croceus]|uniref:TetR family transcriptional regulator n=1 Tax=Urechidicola croceus TaxID=1850246 RepID=A0A1D8PA26_9FLAO|nr:TetR/AcrR family transcriptional regulator [Urechidicola croceus]AOW21440.1 TetR family transcriptional regulator [Urechidicola croceus]
MKEKILEKSAEMFLNYGFKSVTMDDIAEQLGISKKTIYAHFENKTKLVQEATLAVFESISYGIDCICKLEKNPIEELFAIKTFVLEHLKNEKSSPQYQLQKYYPKLFSSLKKKQLEVMRECVVENLNKGIIQEYYRNELDVNFISRVYFNGMIGIKDVETFPSSEYEPKYLMESYLEYHIRAIATEKGLQTLQNLLSNNEN